MKIKPLIIVFAALCAIWLLVLPLLVGLYLRGAVPEWTANWPDAEAVEYSPGWFRSSLRWASSDGIQLELQARHVPPLRAGLVRVDGLLRSPITPDAAQIQGHVGLTGGWNLKALMGQIADPGSLGLQAREVALNLAQPAGQPMTLILSAAQIGPENTSAAALGPAVLMARQHADDEGRRHLGLDLQLSSAELGQAALTLSAGPADPLLLASLIDGLVQWAGSAPGSLLQRLALLSVAGAWQQLAEDGMVIRIERLDLGEHTRILARWPIRQPLPEFEGRGRSDELNAWFASLGELGGQPVEQTEMVVQAMLLALAQNGWIRLDGEHFETTMPAP